MGHSKRAGLLAAVAASVVLLAACNPDIGREINVIWAASSTYGSHTYTWSGAGGWVEVQMTSGSESDVYVFTPQPATECSSAGAPVACQVTRDGLRVQLNRLAAGTGYVRFLKMPAGGELTVGIYGSPVGVYTVNVRVVDDTGNPVGIM